MYAFSNKKEYREACIKLKETCNEIRELINVGNIYLARKQIVDNLKIFPNDYELNKLLARILVLEQNYEQALDIYETKLVEEANFQKLMALNIKLGNEEKIYELYNKFYKSGNPYNNERINEKFKRKIGYEHYKLMRHYLMKKYDKNYKPVLEELDYNKRQIYTYSTKELIEYTTNNYSIVNTEAVRYFKDSNNIPKIVEVAQKYIVENPDKCTIRNNVFDYYYFHSRNCGITNNQEPLNHFAAYTFINDPNIIMLVPEGYGHRPSSLVCYLDEQIKEDKALKKVRKPQTGLERFNARYNK